MNTLFLLFVLASAVVVLLTGRSLHRRKSKGRLPPGPTPLPIIGNILDIPRTNVGPTFLALSKKHGDILYFDILGQPMVVLGSVKAAFDLLEKKSANFSGRPVSVVMKLFGLDSLFALMQYGAPWRHHRRAFHLSFGVDRVAQYQPIQLTSARRLLSRLLASPDKLEENMNISVADTSMRAIYGIDIAAKDSDGELYRMTERLRELVDVPLLLGGSFLEIFPFLRYFPSWLPGMQINKTIVEGRRALHATLDRLHTMSTAANREGIVEESMVARLLGDAETKDLQSTEILKELTQSVALTTFIGSTDTTHATMEVLFLAAAMHPDKQKAAQEELDAAVGHGRLPDFSDYDHLPYVQAFVKELMRWHVVAPLGLPHATMEDDEYNGFFIPARTIVNANIWALSKDPDEYPDPDAFKPERFLGDKPPRDPADYVFGFGRRACPGRHFAAASLFIHCASVLHVFDIMPPKDANGNPVVMKYRPNDDIVSHIDGYDYIIQPRSAEAKSLVTDLML